MTTKTKATAWALLLAPGAATSGTGEAREAPAAETAVAERGDLFVTVQDTGTLEPVRQVEVKSKASGEVTEPAVDVVGLPALWQGGAGVPRSGSGGGGPGPGSQS